MSAKPPTHTVEVMAAIGRCPGLTIKGIADATGLNRGTVYRAAYWLEARGDVERDDSWPAGWSPVSLSDAELDSLSDAADLLNTIEELLDEAMTLPQWRAVPGTVKHKIEHAKVELMRSRGEVG